MPTWVYVLIGIAVVALIVVAASMMLSRRRSTGLKSAFSSEYDRTVASTGSRREAEQELRERQKRREKLVIVPLTGPVRERYSQRWETVQSEFVDAPVAAVRDANELVQQVMSDRGYPMQDFEQQAADVSVDHPDVVSNYRAAYAVWCRCEDGSASTEDLRQAMRHYRSLFDELLADEREPSAAAERERERVAR
jgi:hypothetical protein